MARSLIQAHERVKSLDWKYSYENHGGIRYHTKYHIPSKTKDPFRQLMRDFLSMESEKDERAYGGLQDVLARTGAVNQSAPQLAEVLKPVLPIARDAEYYAMQLMMVLSNVVDNSELRQGYLAQELDEIRHVQAETWLARYYARQYKDPAGFDVGPRCREWNPFMMPLRAGFSNMLANDPIASCLCLQVVVETAYTNPFFVAQTEVASRSGDQVLPSMFLSIQSDEGRHMANGYATLSAVLSDDRNLEFVNQDLNDMFWRTHRPFDQLLGIMFDYMRDPTIDCPAYRHYWDQWIWNDWGGSYIANLQKFDLEIPPTLEIARQDINWLPHTGAFLLHALWPINFFRQQVVPESRFDWFENNYPGWGTVYAPLWQMAAEVADPSSGALALQAFPELPPFCRTCILPCVYPRLDKSHLLVEEHAGRRHAFCSTTCRDMFTREPERYLGYQNFGERFHGWGLDEVIINMGLLRSDGKTLIGQPHLNLERMWTIDDIRQVGYEIKYPFAT